MKTIYNVYYYIDEQEFLESFNTFKEANSFIQDKVKVNGYHYMLYRDRNDGKPEIVLGSG